MIFGLSIYFIIMHFFIFGIFGWIYESCFVSIRDRHLVNRGFLVGPFLPLYGTGATLVYIFLRPFTGNASLLYFSGAIIATVIEYITSFLLEKIFHAKWWDYSKEPYNFQGRVALIPSMFWGVLSLLLFDLFEPAVNVIINLIPEKYKFHIMYGLIIIAGLDLMYTLITTINFSKQLETLYYIREELESQLEDISFGSIRDAISAKTLNLNEKKDIIFEKFKYLKESYGAESKFASMEQKLKNYFERHTAFLKRKPMTGAKRIIKAFPTMKYIPKKAISIDVKEFINNMNIRNLRRK